MKRFFVLPALLLMVVAVFAGDKNPVVGGQEMLPTNNHHAEPGQIRRPHHAGCSH